MIVVLKVEPIVSWRGEVHRV